MLATFLLGFILSLTLMIAVFVGIIFYIRKRQVGFREADISSDKRGYVNGSTKLRYVCLSCGTKVSGRTCRKCGSHMKKVVF